MNKRKLLKLAAMLEADAKNKKGIKFDLEIVASASITNFSVTTAEFPDGKQPTLDCETAACAIGLACLSGKFKGLSYSITKLGFFNVVVNGHTASFESSYKIFDLTVSEGEWLFVPWSYDKSPKGAKGERLVAKRIRDFVSGKANPPSPWN